jgi:opacity protein-like surface antigen
MGFFRASIARSSALSLAALAWAAATASAQTSASLDGGYQHLTNARRSAEAVLGSPGGPTFGASFRYPLGRSAFVGGTARFFRQEGERAFVAEPGSPVFHLGHPLTVQIVPVYATFGWRFSPDATFVPYAGAGLGAAFYRETSTVAGVELDPVSRTKASGLAFGGVEYGRGRVRFGLEGSYALAPKTLDAGGVGAVYDESDVGGLAVVGRVVFVF